MPRKHSPSAASRRSSPTRRHIPTDAPVSSTSRPGLVDPYSRSPLSSSYSLPGEVPQPSYSETILQRPTIATDHSQLNPSNLAPDTASASSRRQSASSMRNASMTFENVVPTATPTGRISKAKKGKRVHACEFPGCGKVFTRAEHRRRHELNHNPEASYRCPRPDCGKSFHRLDLLQRHQERHDLEASSALSRPPSNSNVFAPSSSGMPSGTLQSPPQTDSAPRTNLSIGSLVNPQSRGYTTGTSMGLGFSMGYMAAAYPTPEYPYFDGSETSGQSPLSDNFVRYPHRQSISSASSNAGYDPVSTSPMITSSVPNNWIPASAPPSMLPTTMFDESTAFSVPVSPPIFFAQPYLLTEADQSPTVSAVPIPLSDMDGHEWSTIQHELRESPGLIFESAGSSHVVRWDCLEHYWQYFHPSFPVVHRPTFLRSQPSPLLVCATLAIGSLYDVRPDAARYSLALQEIATQLLKRRPEITGRSRISDLQTVLLLEILSKYCARQISVQAGPRFRALFASLQSSRQWLVTKPLAIFKTLKEKTPEEISKAKKFWIEHETRQRIFQACTVLDAQQIALFGQPPTVLRHEVTRNGTNNSKAAMHLPCEEQLWESPTDADWSAHASKADNVDVNVARSAYQSASVGDYSFFQHQIINANSTDGLRCSEEMSSPGRMGAPLSKTRFNYHVFQMAQNVPIHQLLIVAGESWLFGRKVEQELDYVSAKQAIREWVGQSATFPLSREAPRTLLALWHALKVLRMLINVEEGDSDVFRSTNMLHEDWAVYLAVIVCWAHGYQRGFAQNLCSEYGASTTLEQLPPTPASVSASTTRQNSVAMAAPKVEGPQSTAADASTLQQLSPSSVRRHSTASTVYNYSPSSRHAATSNSARKASLVPAAIGQDGAVHDMRQYLAQTDVRSPQALGNLAPIVLGRTKGLMDTVRIQKFGRKGVIGGLINDAERVLARLTNATGRTTGDMF